MSLTTKFKERVLQQSVGYCVVCKERMYLNEDGSSCDCLCTEKTNPKEVKDFTDLSYTIREKVLAELILAKKNLLLDGKDIKGLNQVDENSSLEYKVYKNHFKEIIYLNIPKMQQLALICRSKLDLELYNEKKTLHLQAWMQTKIFEELKKFFSNTKIEALPIYKEKTIHKKYIGALAYFDELEFSSSNIGDKDENTYSFIYHIHKNGWRLELYINKDWFTTNNIFMKFKSKEIGKLSSLFRITNVDKEKNTIYGAPIIIFV